MGDGRNSQESPGLTLEDLSVTQLSVKFISWTVSVTALTSLSDIYVVYLSFIYSFFVKSRKGLQYCLSRKLQYYCPCTNTHIQIYYRC
jgi:hypothetical protein